MSRPFLPPPRWLLGAVLVGGFLVALSWIGLWLYIPGAFFLPDYEVDMEEGAAVEEPLPEQEVSFPSEDGEVLRATWYPRADAAGRAVLFLHGNAADRAIPSRVRTAALFHDLGYHVLVLDYRGYGGSEGRPTHEGVLADTRAAIGWLAGREEVDEIVLYGHSLGGALALCAPGEVAQIRGVVTQGAYDSSRAMVARGLAHYVGESAGERLSRWLFASPIEPLRCLESWAGKPVLLMHGSEDPIIPVEAAHRLYQAFPDSGAELWVEDALFHAEAMEVAPDRYRARLEEFLERAFRGGGRRTEARIEGGTVVIRCAAASEGEEEEVELHLWDGRGELAWRRVRVTCPQERVPTSDLSLELVPRGAAAVPALPPDEPTAKGREILEIYREFLAEGEAEPAE